LLLRKLEQISVIGLGLLGGSISLAIRHFMPGIKVVGFSHRPATRRKARRLAVASQVVDNLCESVKNADLVILATPIFTCEEIFTEISSELRTGCIVTDVGSTKVMPHRWAGRTLPKTVFYVGSHPVAGSEQRGIETARADLFERSRCIITTTRTTNRQAVSTLKRFWSQLGCDISLMSPIQHDRIFANVSHLPHVFAATLVSLIDIEEMKFAGKGFADTTRIASGPANVWTDVLLANGGNVSRGIDRVIRRLSKLQKALNVKDKDWIDSFLSSARNKRAIFLNYKIHRKEPVS
jgi:prephenate dehydrogenase